MSINACSSTFIFSVLISVFPWFSMTVLVTSWFFVPAWVTLKLWKGVFSYNFGMENLMVQSVFSEHQWMFINFHLFSVDQCVSLIFHESYSYLLIFCANMSDIKTMKMSVFIQFRYGEFNGAICFWWAPMYVHQLSYFQCWSVSFLDFPQKLKLLDNYFYQHEWH